MSWKRPRRICCSSVTFGRCFSAAKHDLQVQHRSPGRSASLSSLQEALFNRRKSDFVVSFPANLYLAQLRLVPALFVYPSAVFQLLIIKRRLNGFIVPVIHSLTSSTQLFCNYLYFICHALKHKDAAGWIWSAITCVLQFITLSSFLLTKISPEDVTQWRINHLCLFNRNSWPQYLMLKHHRDNKAIIANTKRIASSIKHFSASTFFERWLWWVFANQSDIG